MAGRRAGIPAVGGRRRQEAGVLDPAHHLARVVVADHVLQRGADRQHAQALLDRQPFHGPERAEYEAHSRETLHQLLRQRGVHVVDVRDPAHLAQHRRDERRLLHRMDRVVAPPADHPQALGQQQEVVGDLLEREAGPHVPDLGQPANPVEAAVGEVQVLAFREGQNVHLMAPRTQEFQDRAHRDRCARGPGRTGAARASGFS